MRRLIVKRLAAMVVIILALTAVMFMLAKISPLDPVHAMLGPNASRQALATQRHMLGLDRPLIDQYGRYSAVPSARPTGPGAGSRRISARSSPPPLS